MMQNDSLTIFLHHTHLPTPTNCHISNSSLSSLLKHFIGIRPKPGILPDSETFKKTNSKAK